MTTLKPCSVKPRGHVMNEVGPVSVLGATGFVGRAVVGALRARQVEVRAVRSPRVGEPISAVDREATVKELTAALRGSTAVVNAAGVADAAGTLRGPMRGANAVLPGIVAEAARRTGIRLVHVSSAAVQGPRDVLDSSPQLAPFSPYSQSKADGERAVLCSCADAVIYRPPGVHGTDRPLTRTVTRLARSAASSVAGDGSQATANALIGNVGDAIAHLTATPSALPRIVHHPSEGLTTADLLEALGGRKPRHVPMPLARVAISAVRTAGRVHPPLLAQARRIEMLWFGQRQAPSWLLQDGWEPPHGRREWTRMGETLRAEIQSKGST